MKIDRNSSGEMEFRDAPDGSAFQFTEEDDDAVYIKVKYEGQEVSAVCLKTGESLQLRQNGGYAWRVRIFPNATLLLHGECGKGLPEGGPR
jgi:hypothetical protein